MRSCTKLFVTPEEAHSSTMTVRRSPSSIFAACLFVVWYYCAVADANAIEPLFMGSLEFDNTDRECRDYIGDKLTLYILHSEQRGADGDDVSMKYLSIGSVRQLRPSRYGNPRLLV